MFFAESGQIALAAIAGAAVVGVTVLFEFRRYRAVVIGAMQQTGKREFVLAVLRFVVTSKHGLHLLEEFRADERSVRAVVEFVFPDELAFVEGVFK
ncbi:MAG: hypothetical protein WAM59_07300 [Candidatus Acidiferrales bacterium]